MTKEYPERPGQHRDAANSRILLGNGASCAMATPCGDDKGGSRHVLASRLPAPQIAPASVAGNRRE